MAQLLRILLPLCVLGVGYFGFQFFNEEPEKTIRKRPPKKEIIVEVSTLAREDFRVRLMSQGIVQPHNETTLTPRVSGRITRISPAFESGSFFEKDAVLLELDQTDFRAGLTTSEARLARAEASLAQEDARAEQALLDWKDLGYTDPPTDLVLRKPQLKEARANVKAAMAELEEARRNLSRTKIRAPYAGRVQTRLVGLGQSVTPGTRLGEIFSTDFAEVRLSLSARELMHVKLPDNPDDSPIPVTLTDGLTEGSPATWEGSIVRTEGALDEKSRKLFVIARVNDPFGLKKEGQPQMRIGQPVRAELEGGLIPSVFVIPRETLRRPNEILLVDPEKLTLKRQRINPVWTDLENLVVQVDLEEGWHLVTKRLATAPNGAKVTIIFPDETSHDTASSLNPKPRS